MTPDATKHCRMCGHERPLADFGVDRSRKGGLSPLCRDHRRQVTREAKERDRRRRGVPMGRGTHRRVASPAAPTAPVSGVALAASTLYRVVELDGSEAATCHGVHEALFWGRRMAQRDRRAYLVANPAGFVIAAAVPPLRSSAEAFKAARMMNDARWREVA